MLTNGEMMEMRDTLNRTLIDTCTVKRRTRVTDNRGGQTETLSFVGTYPSRIDSGTTPSGASLIGDRVTERNIYTIFMPFDADIRSNDQIEHGIRKFDVLGIVVRSFTIGTEIVVSEHV